MKHLWVALTVLALSAFTPGDLSAQGISTQSGRARGPGLELGQNFPNPVVENTRIPFTIGDGAGCTDSGRLHRVSLQIYNILYRLISVPVLQGGTGNVAGGEPVDGLLLTCNKYLAFWDGKDSTTQEAVGPGIYLYRLEVDGRPVTKKMLVSK